MSAESKKDKRENGSALQGALLAAAATECVSRYGSGLKEYLVAYSGVDNETGFKWQQSLKSISKRAIKIDPNNPEKSYYQQLRAHSGYSAEIKEVARRRAEEAISGQKPKTLRTDDIPRTDGGSNVNHPLYDISSEVDSKGNPIPGSSMQMKFRGKTAADCLDILSGKDCRKYVENDCKLMVPKDFYDDMKVEVSKKIETLQKEIKRLEEIGNEKALEVRRAELEKYKTIDKNLVKSKVSNDEAKDAYLDPESSTAKDIIATAHDAGMRQLKMGAAIGGGVSLAKNLVSLYKGEKKVKDAVVGVAGDTAGAAAASYGIAFTGAILKGTAQNATSDYIRALSKTNLPAFIASTTLEVGKVLTAYARGKIDGAECIEQLGTRGYCMTTSAMYAAIGQVVIPIPVVGAMAGNMFGYFVGSASYKVLKDSLKLAKVARAERIRIERECDEAIRMMRENRKALQQQIDRYLANETGFFEVVFGSIKECLEIGDVDGYIAGANSIVRHLGKRPQYETREQFDALMAARDEPMSF